MAERNIQDFLESLTDSERTELRSKLVYADRKQRDAFARKDSTTEAEDQVWFALGTCVPGLGPRQRMIGSGGNRITRDQWEFAVESMHALIDEQCGTLRRGQKEDILATLFACLKSMNRMLGKSASARELIYAVGNLVDAIDLEFPGYAEAGLLHLLATPKVA